MNKKEIIKTILFYVLMIGLVIALRRFVFTPVEAVGDSMKPTLNNGERMFGLKHTALDRFDIVTFPAPDNPGAEYVKRVIGLPGILSLTKRISFILMARNTVSLIWTNTKKKLRMACR